MTWAHGGRRGTTNVEVNEDEFSPSQLMRLARLGRELRLTDQILTTDMDTVSIVEAGPAPAWTNLEGDHVSFAMKRMPFPKEPVDVAVWLGTNAHELGHVMFSPRRESPLMQRVIDGDRLFMPGLFKVYNIVEDQREERLMLAKFSPWEPYLVAALGHHIKADSQSAWLLLAGRTWLAQANRDQARRAFVKARGEAVAVEVARLIGAYQRLFDPGWSQQDSAFDILEALHNIFVDQMPDHGGCGGGVISGGDPDTDPPEPEDLPPAADDPPPGEGDGPGEPGEGDGPAGEGQPTDQPPQGDGGTAAGKGPGKPQPFDPAKLRKDLKAQAKKDLEADGEAKEDIDSILDALDHGREAGDVDAPPAEGKTMPATDAARRLWHEVGDALMDLKDQSEPGWVKRTAAGKVNVRRVLTGVDIDQCYDQYQPGQMDASEMEMVLLLDVSGSMNSKLRKLGEATWAIRRAVDDLGGRLTVICWESGPHRVLAQPDERPDDRMFVPAAMGGTDPSSALADAYKVLAESQAKNRLMVVMTDGAWFGWSTGHRTPEKLIQAMNEVGITTAYAYLSHKVYDGAGPLDGKGCQYAEEIDSPAGLARLFRRVAADQIGRWGR